MTGIIGAEVYIPQWGEAGRVVGFDADALCYSVKMDSGDDAYVPMFYVEVLH